jgi:glycosyltransferase involved in cell wall biosynthesis
VLISVIVPFLNEERYIAGCAESLLDQDFDQEQYEIIFVDNGATDDSSKIVSRYERITLLHEGKKGSYAARNRGIREAGGEILAFTDANCEVAPDWLSQIHTGMNDESTAIVAGRRHIGGGRSRVLRMLEDYENAKVEYLLARPDHKQHFFGLTNNMAFRASVFERCGPFPEIMRGGDTQFVQQFLAREPDRTLTYLPKMIICHVEVDSLLQWLKKQVIRGENNSKISRVSTYRNLGNEQKLRVFAHNIRHNGYSYFGAAGCFALLLLGSGFYKLGELKNHFS